MASATPSEPRSRPRTPAKPVVLFFDDRGYEQFDQLACTLKRRGVGAIRLRVPPLPSRRQSRKLARGLRDRWFYDRCFALDGPEAQALLDEGRLGRFEVRDVVLVESAVAAVGLRSPVLRQLSGRAQALSAQPPERLFDKFEANVLLAQAGLSVPRQIAATQVNAAAAAAILGLPLVVKTRQGLAGDGVAICHSVEAADRARRQLDPEGTGELFYQAYILGAVVGYGCVQGPDGPLLDYGFRVETWQWDLGPPAEVSLDDDPQLLAAGRRAAAALGCQGFIQIDFIRDADGGIWPLDVNPRPWSQVLSMLGLGIDFAGAYAGLVLGQPHASTLPSPVGQPQSQPIFPFALYEAVRSGSVALVQARAGRFMRMCRRGPGAPYELIVAAKAAQLLIERLTRGLAIPASGGPAPHVRGAKRGAS